MNFLKDEIPKSWHRKAHKLVDSITSLKARRELKLLAKIAFAQAEECERAYKKDPTNMAAYHNYLELLLISTVFGMGAITMPDKEKKKAA